ncbi:hypothetical protein VTI74DRAFT_11296 [Chaetomium olivicolor]
MLIDMLENEADSNPVTTNKVGPWTPDTEAAYTKFVLGGGAEPFLRQLRENEEL